MCKIIYTHFNRTFKLHDRINIFQSELAPWDLHHDHTQRTSTRGPQQDTDRDSTLSEKNGRRRLRQHLRTRPKAPTMDEGVTAEQGPWDDGAISCHARRVESLSWNWPRWPRRKWLSWKNMSWQWVLIPLRAKGFIMTPWNYHDYGFGLLECK